MIGVYVGNWKYSPIRDWMVGQCIADRITQRTHIVFQNTFSVSASMCQNIFWLLSELFNICPIRIILWRNMVCLSSHRGLIELHQCRKLMLDLREFHIYDIYDISIVGLSYTVCSWLADNKVNVITSNTIWFLAYIFFVWSTFETSLHELQNQVAKLHTESPHKLIKYVEQMQIKKRVQWLHRTVFFSADQWVLPISYNMEVITLRPSDALNEPSSKPVLEYFVLNL